MNEATRVALSGWSGFYVILGSASGAVIGLMFVAVTLISSMHHRGERTSLVAFGTPTIVQPVAPLVLRALDWIWFRVAPLSGYAALPVAAFELRWHLETGLFVIAAVTLALMLVAIRNAWDTATYVAVERRET